MYSYVTEYLGRKILVKTGRKENYLEEVRRAFNLKNIKLPETECLINFFDESLGLSYEINCEDLPDHASHVKLTFAEPPESNVPPM